MVSVVSTVIVFYLIIVFSTRPPACPPGNAVRQPDKSVLAGTGTYSGRQVIRAIDCDNQWLGIFRTDNG